MNEYTLNAEDVVGVFPAAEKTGIFKRIQKVNIRDSKNMSVVLREGLNCERIEPMEDGIVVTGDKQVLLLSRETFETAMTFTRIRQEGDHPWDMILKSQFRIVYPNTFAERLGPGMLACGRRLQADAIGKLVENAILVYVQDEISQSKFNIDDLKSGRTHPQKWWNTQLGKWLAEFGCEWELSGLPEWKSASAEAAQAETERKAALEKQRQIAKEQQMAQQEIQRLQVETNEARKNLEQAQNISEFQRKQSLILLEHEAELKRKEAEANLRQAQWRSDELALEHEANVAELQGRRQEAEEQEQIRQELREQNRQAIALAQEQQQQTRSDFECLKQCFEALIQQGQKGHQEHSSLLQEIKTSLAESVEAGRLNRSQADTQSSQLLAMLAQIRDTLADSTKAKTEGEYRLAELMASADLGFSTGQLKALGFDTTLQDFVALVCRAAQDRPRLRLEMASLRVQTREVKMCRRDESKPTTGQVNTLRIGGWLDMEFRSARDGCFTLLNFGTSGSVWICVPNVGCSLGKAKVQTGQNYQFPGCSMLPPTMPTGELMDLQEVGPIGREHMIVVISEEPLIDSEIEQRIDALKDQNGLPFLRLVPEEIKRLHSRLACWNETDWDSAVLSFDVVP
jgi:hypothetical protein